MKLAHITMGKETSEETKEKTIDLAKAMGKQATFSNDSPGQVTSRLLMA